MAVKAGVRARGLGAVTEVERVEAGGSAKVAAARTSPEAMGWALHPADSVAVGTAAAEAAVIAQESVGARGATAGRGATGV